MNWGLLLNCCLLSVVCFLLSGVCRLKTHLEDGNELRLAPQLLGEHLHLLRLLLQQLLLRLLTKTLEGEGRSYSHTNVLANNQQEKCQDEKSID